MVSRPQGFVLKSRQDCYPIEDGRWALCWLHSDHGMFHLWTLYGCIDGYLYCTKGRWYEHRTPWQGIRPQDCACGLDLVLPGMPSAWWHYIYIYIYITTPSTQVTTSKRSTLLRYVDDLSLDSPNLTIRVRGETNGKLNTYQIPRFSRQTMATSFRLASRTIHNESN